MGAVSAHAEFLYGEEKVTPFAPAPGGLLRDARAEKRARAAAGNLLAARRGRQCRPVQHRRRRNGLHLSGRGRACPADRGEVYLSDAFRNLQAAPPKIAVGVSVHGSVLDLEVDTGEFPVGGAAGLAQISPPEKAVSPPERRAAAPAGRLAGGVGRAERDAGTLGREARAGPHPAAVVPGSQPGLGPLGPERHPLQPGRRVPADQPELPCGERQ